MSGTTETSSMRRLPYMSPSRPATGVATAADSRVAVITQDAFEAVVFSRLGSVPISGTTRVCMSAATMPARASTATMPPGRAMCLASVMRAPAPRRNTFDLYATQYVHDTQDVCPA